MKELLEKVTKAKTKLSDAQTAYNEAIASIDEALKDKSVSKDQMVLVQGEPHKVVEVKGANKSFLSLVPKKCKELDEDEVVSIELTD